MVNMRAGLLRLGTVCDEYRLGVRRAPHNLNYRDDLTIAASVSDIQVSA